MECCKQVQVGGCIVVYNYTAVSPVVVFFYRCELLISYEHSALFSRAFCMHAGEADAGWEQSCDVPFERGLLLRLLVAGGGGWGVKRFVDARGGGQTRVRGRG